MLRDLRLQAGEPSFAEITARIARVRGERGASPYTARPGRVTVYDAFRDGRRRMDPELLADIAISLGFPQREAELRALYAAAVGGQPREAARPDIAFLDATAGSDLIGREEDLARARALLSAGPGPRRLLVAGMAGVGKSAFALALATEMARERTAQIVRVSLRTASGDDGKAAADPAVVLRQLRDYVAGAPADGGLVVVLDDAITREGLARFAMGLGQATTLIATSRRRLEGAMPRLDLPPMSDDALAGVLAAQIPPDMGRETDALLALAEHCGGLPLAASVLAGQVAARPTWLLTDHLRRLRAIDRGLAPALEDVLQALGTPEQQVLSLLAVHPGPLTTEEAALTLRDSMKPAAVEQALQTLRLENLVHQEATGSLVLHDVVRSLAADLAYDLVPASQRTRQVQTLAGSLATRLTTAIERADLTSPPDEVLESLFPPVATEGSPEALAVPRDPQECRTWLEAHIALAVTTTQLAAEEGLAHEVTVLAASGMQYLLWKRDPVDAYRLVRTAMRHGAEDSRMYFTLETAGIASALGLLDEADTLLAEVAEHGTPAMRIEATAQRALNEMWKRHLPTGIEFARSALTQAQGAGLTPMAQAIATQLLRAVTLAGRPDEALEIHHATFPAPEGPSGYYGVVSLVALAEAHLERGEVDLARAALETATSIGDGGTFPAQNVATLRHRMRALRGEDSSAEADSFVSGASNDTLVVMGQVARATTDRIAGRAAQAVDQARAVLASDPPENMNPFRVSANELALALALAEGGDPVQAREVAERATTAASERGVHLISAYGAAVQAYCASLEGDPAAADALAAVREDPATSPLLRGWITHHLDPTGPDPVMRRLVVP